MRKVFDDAGNVTQHYIRTLHTEQNEIIQAAKFGVSIDGATLYCKMVPCRSCAMMIVNSGIKCVVAEKHYHVEADSVKMFKDPGIGLVIMNDEVEKYDRQ